MGSGAPSGAPAPAPKRQTSLTVERTFRIQEWYFHFHVERCARPGWQAAGEQNHDRCVAVPWVAPAGIVRCGEAHLPALRLEAGLDRKTGGLGGNLGSSGAARHICVPTLSRRFDESRKPRLLDLHPVRDLTEIENRLRQGHHARVWI